MPHGTPGTAWRVQHGSVRNAHRPWWFKPDRKGDHYMCERSDLELVDE